MSSQILITLLGFAIGVFAVFVPGGAYALWRNGNIDVFYQGNFWTFIGASLLPTIVGVILMLAYIFLYLPKSNASAGMAIIWFIPLSAFAVVLSSLYYVWKYHSTPNIEAFTSGLIVGLVPYAFAGLLLIWIIIVEKKSPYPPG